MKGGGEDCCVFGGDNSARSHNDPAVPDEEDDEVHELLQLCDMGRKRQPEEVDTRSTDNMKYVRQCKKTKKEQTQLAIVVAEKESISTHSTIVSLMSTGVQPDKGVLVSSALAAPQLGMCLYEFARRPAKLDGNRNVLTRHHEAAASVATEIAACQQPESVLLAKVAHPS